MAFASSFDESNEVLAAPPGMSADQCEPLSVLRLTDAAGTPIVVSCWKLTQRELDEVNRTGRVWLGIVDHTMPPAFIAGEKPFMVNMEQT